MGSSRTGTSLPPSLPPERSTEILPEGDPYESGLHRVASGVANAVRDHRTAQAVRVALESLGRVVGGTELLATAAVVISDAPGGARATATALRREARSDAALVVLLGSEVPSSEYDDAYEAGALFCLPASVDPRHLAATVTSALELSTARGEADDLRRQLDWQSHLASLGRVTAGFTHEVSNPLSAMRTNLELLRDQADLSGPNATNRTLSAPEVREVLEEMTAAFARVQQLLERTRELSRSARVRMGKVDLTKAVADVRRWAARELDGVEVREVIDAPLVARADPHLLGQVLVNLVTNAAYAAKRLAAPRIRLHLYEFDGDAVVSVRDNGPGIPPEIQDRIFEPFFTTRRGQGGTGLGLSLCLEYVRQMQARLSLWTAVGRGTCVRLHLQRV